MLFRTPTGSEKFFGGSCSCMAAFLLSLMLRDFEKTFAGPLQPLDCKPPLVLPEPHCAPAMDTREVTLLSWNLLCTRYVRPQRESEAVGLMRVQQQLDYVQAHDPDIVGLQEFWCADKKYVDLWKQFAAEHRYILHVCPRTNGKADGCALLVRAGLSSRPLTWSAWHYDDWGSRVVQMCELEIGGVPLTLLQTHLTFPHGSEVRTQGLES